MSNPDRVADCHGRTDEGFLYHSDCGMLTFKDDDLKDRIQADTGIR